jgi:molybdate transport system substrate-binding protein
VTLHIISAGAAQSVVQQVIEDWKRRKVADVAVSYGAVGAQKNKLLDGAPADLVILTAALIDELAAAGHIVAGTRADLGAVVGGIAVPNDAPHPAVATPQALAGALRDASAIYIPDPAIATAGAQFMAMCSRLGIAADVTGKVQAFANGFAAMTRMAEECRPGAIGCTQVTEIRYVAGVELVAPLPKTLQVPTVYSLGIAARASDPATARAFARSLAGDEAAAMRYAAGFGVT